MFSQKAREGYILVDHRASPGFTREQAEQLHLPYEQVKEGAVFEAASLTCAHCKCAVLKNPLRTRERPHCFKCNHYICDHCEFLSRQSDYIHTPFEANLYK
jgi:hypothetical protein